MNERILELARQVWPDPNISHVNHMKFAELIVRECVDACLHDDWEDPSRGRFYANKIREHFGIEE